jgi:hypothetical protein
MAVELLTDSDRVTLQTVCEKIVAYGERVGVSPATMISLLQQGGSVRDLLQFLAATATPSN